MQSQTDIWPEDQYTALADIHPTTEARTPVNLISATSLPIPLSGQQQCLQYNLLYDAHNLLLVRDRLSTNNLKQENCK